jgi:hypothetical protein
MPVTGLTRPRAVSSKCSPSPDLSGIEDFQELTPGNPQVLQRYLTQISLFFYWAAAIAPWNPGRPTP